ncbi:hypothetical protein CALVIDRAFT_253653 [Calocera viscosa TUFC12733]|uniref:Uncharacterized protein n=1 Tax=Calocera viscosa (strain TUFC12733) TaxID=1330018 RepID=A0A167J755_CALVF|nr:hypothetical protein CALVIDRAFT_253653 [Calocera viscosa TUFC12733]
MGGIRYVREGRGAGGGGKKRTRADPPESRARSSNRTRAPNPKKIPGLDPTDESAPGASRPPRPAHLSRPAPPCGRLIIKCTCFPRQISRLLLQFGSLPAAVAAPTIVARPPPTRRSPNEPIIGRGLPYCAPAYSFDAEQTHSRSTCLASFVPCPAWRDVLRRLPLTAGHPEPVGRAWNFALRSALFHRPSPPSLAAWKDAAHDVSTRSRSLYGLSGKLRSGPVTQTAPVGLVSVPDIQLVFDLRFHGTFYQKGFPLSFSIAQRFIILILSIVLFTPSSPSLRYLWIHQHAEVRLSICRTGILNSPKLPS